MEHIGEEQPPGEDSNTEPEKKRFRKSRWDPVEDPKPFVDRKRLSEFDFLSFFPVWDYRKMTRQAHIWFKLVLYDF